jgi:hypothetical protein
VATKRRRRSDSRARRERRRNPVTKTFDPNLWEGETEDLLLHVETLAHDPDLCDSTFVSKHEAFYSGLRLGRLAHERDSNGGV